MTRLFLSMLLLLISSLLFANDLSGKYIGSIPFPAEVESEKYLAYASYYFWENKYKLVIDGIDNITNIPKDLITIRENSYDSYTEEGTWKINNIQNQEVITFSSNNNFTYKQKLGILYHSKNLFLYDEKVFFESVQHYRVHEAGPWIDSIRSSSFLKEGDIEYNSDQVNNSYYNNLLPWVEGVAGYGIGEWIELKVKSNVIPIIYFLFSNGYVSFNKPELYKKNSRVKRMRISCEELEIDMEVDLEDTANFQEIKLPEILNSPYETTFIFTILDVYNGTQWDDTCINQIITMFDMPLLNQ